MEYQEQVSALQEQVDYHQNLYDDPECEIEISDPEFDQLKLRLKDLSPDDSRLSHVAGASTGSIGFHRAKVSHGDNPCYSLDKVYTFEEVLTFAAKVARDGSELFDIEVKYDGLTASLSDGVLATSGEGGLVGVDISDKLEIVDIEYAPGTEHITKDLRGEIILKKSMFSNNKHLFVRASNGESYKIPRSACVAQVMSESHIGSLGKFLSFVIFGRHQKTLSLAELRNFEWDEFAAQVQRMDYPADGLVLKLNDREYLDSLGATSHHKKGEMSFKFGNPTGDTVLLDIERSVGKGRITPVGIVEPVEIDGILNGRISLHNLAFIKENDICVGDKIIVERAGNIIPLYKSTIEKAKNRKAPEMSTCPACGEATRFDGTNEFCDNDECDGTLVCQLYDSVIRIGIDTLGKTTIEKLISTLEVNTLLDVFVVTKDDVLSLEGFASISASKLVQAIAQVKDNPIEDWKVLASLNISGIGRRMGKKILKDRTIDDLRNLTTAELLMIDGIGDIRASLIHITLDEQAEYLDTLLSLFPSVINTVEQSVEVKGTVCFTGKTPVKAETRDKFWKVLAEQNGFEVGKSVTKSTSFLVTGDVESNSSKMKKARAAGVQIMDYEAFRGMCG